MRHRAFRLHLQIVGRQEVVFSADHGFKKAPGLTGELLCVGFFLHAKHPLRCERCHLADAPGQNRCQRPKNEKAETDERVWAPQGRNSQCAAGARGERVLTHKGAQRVSRCGLGLLGGGPLQQLPVADCHAPNGTAGGVEQQTRLRKQLAEKPQRRQRAPAQVAHAHVEKVPPGNAAPCRNQPGQPAQQRPGQESRQRDRQRGVQRQSACEDYPGQQQRGHRHDAGAAQVVRHTPQAERVDVVVPRAQHQR